MMISKNIPGVLKNQSTKNLLDMGNMLFNKQILEIKSPKDRYGIAKALPNELTNRMYDNEKTTYPFDKETIAEIKKNYKPLGKEWNKRKEEIKQWIAFENLSNPENENTDLTLSELYQLIMDLDKSGEILNEYNFYIPAEIGAELIKIVCEDNQNNINEIAEIIYKEAKMENPTFEQTLKLFQKYHDDYEKKRKFENDLKDLQSIVDTIIDNTLRHNFKQKSSTEKYTLIGFLPQVLSRKVADFLQFDYDKHFNKFCKVEDSIKKNEPIHRFVFETTTLAYGRRWLSVLDFQDESGEKVKMKTPLKRYKESQIKFVDLANVLESKSYKGKPISDKYLKKLMECYEAIEKNLSDNSLDAFKTYTDKEVEVINDVFDDDIDTIVKCFNALNESIYSDKANIIIHKFGFEKYGYFPKQYFAGDSRHLVDKYDVKKEHRHFSMQLDTLKHHYCTVYNPQIKPPIETEWERHRRAIKKRCEEQKEEYGGNLMMYKPSDRFDEDLRMTIRSKTSFKDGEPNLPTTFEVIEYALEQMQGSNTKPLENEKSSAKDSTSENIKTNENLQYEGIDVYKILAHLKKNKFSKANHRIYVLCRLKKLDEVLEKCDTHKDKYDKLIELGIIKNTSLDRVQKIITYKTNKGHRDYPFKSCAKKIDEILEHHFKITLPK